MPPARAGGRTVSQPLAKAQTPKRRRTSSSAFTASLIVCRSSAATSSVCDTQRPAREEGSPATTGGPAGAHSASPGTRAQSWSSAPWRWPSTPSTCRWARSGTASACRPDRSRRSAWRSRTGARRHSACISGSTHGAESVSGGRATGERAAAGSGGGSGRGGRACCTPAM